MDQKARIGRVFGQYLSHEISLKDFEMWVLANLQSTLDSGDAAAIELANEADVLLMQLGDGLIDEIEFIQAVSGVFRRNIETLSVHRPWLVSSEGNLGTSEGNADTIQPREVSFNLAASEIRLPERVFGRQ